MAGAVFLMLSGGVDSSVAAVTLMQQGYDVRAVFMQCWSEEQLVRLGLDPQDYACAWDEDARDAEWVARKLNIPFEIWDLRAEYFRHVVQYMIEEYQYGKTPNPDVMCNSFIKFGVFANKALAQGADYVATGHYARKVWSTKYQRHLIGRAYDSNKDQSYFLARIQPELVPRSLFPIGEFNSKQAVRTTAQNHDLITAAKPDSQGICFIGDTPLREILLKTLGTRPGNIVDYQTTSDRKTRVLGTHQGAFLYTIGQRHGLGLSDGPWFVHSIDIASNTVFVVHESNAQAVESRDLVARDPVWFIDPNQIDSSPIQAQIRYRQKAQDVVLSRNPNTFALTFSSPARAIAPGQIAALYDDNLLLGSGIIT